MFLSKLQIFTKLRKKSCINISAFGYENREELPIYVRKNIFCYKNKANLKDFSNFMYNQTLHFDKRHFCRYCCQFLVTHNYKKDM